MSKKGKKNAGGGGTPTVIEWPVDWDPPVDIKTRYVNHLWAQHTEHEFILSVYEVHPPLITGDPEQLVGLDGKRLKPDCVARLVLSPGRMEEFVRVMSENLERYKRTFGGDKSA